MVYRSYFLSDCFITHSHSLREEAHTPVACTPYFRKLRINSRIVSVIPSKGFSGSAVPAGAESRKVLIGFWSIDQEKKFTPRAHIYAQSLLVALIRVLSPPQPLLHTLLSPLSLCSNLFFCEYCIHNFFWFY